MAISDENTAENIAKNAINDLCKFSTSRKADKKNV